MRISPTTLILRTAALGLVAGTLATAQPAFAQPASDLAPLPIDDLWRSESFRKTVTGSYGIDSRIEPRITTDEEFYLDAAATAMSEEDREKAIETLTDASILERSPAMQFMLGTLHFEAGNQEEAETALRAALETFPNFRDAHRNLAILLVRQDKYDEAEEHLVRAVELGSREGLTMGLLGYCHAVDENHQASLDAYRLAALTEPDETQWKLGKARALLALDEPRRAAEIYQEILDESPSDWNLWLVQADAWIALDRPLTAAANLEVARRGDRLSADGLLSLGHIFLENDLVDLAVDRYEEAFRHDQPVAPEPAIEALEYLAGLRRFPEAKQLLPVLEEEEIVAPGKLPSARQSPFDPDALDGRWERLTSLIEIEVGDAEAGARHLEEWLRREPTDGLALLLLARHHRQTGAREEAEMLYEQAAGLPEHAAEAHKAHGKLLVDAGDYEAAVDKLEQSLALEADPGLADYVEAVRELVE